MKQKQKQKLCRTCLHNNKELINITNQISDMINGITSLLITPDDGLSQLICNKCVKEIKRAYKFRRKCLEAAKVLEKTKLDECIEVKTEDDKTDVDIKIEPEISENEDFDDEDDWKPIKNEHEHDTVNLPKEFNNINVDSKENYQKAIFDCPFCHAPFASLKVFKNHMQSTHPEQNEDIYIMIQNRPPLGFVCRNDKKEKNFDYKCACSNFTASEYSALLEHFKEHYGNKPIVCTFCEYKCADLHLLRNHMLIHTSERPFACTACDYTCKNSTALRIHSATHSSEKNYQCKQCPLTFKRASALSLHKTKVHDKKRNHACHLCEKRFLTSAYLRQHMAVHTGERPHICHLCGWAFSQISNLKKHISVKHEGSEGSKRFKCEICDFSSKHAISVTRHMSRHTGVKDYKCDQCHYLTNNQYTLKLHMLRHTGETRFSCELCDYKCYERASLKNHSTIHTGERNFLCDLCSYTAATRGALRRHKETHSTELKYSCPNCSYRTNVREVLNKHIRKKCQMKAKNSEQAPSEINYNDNPREATKDSSECCSK